MKYSDINTDNLTPEEKKLFQELVDKANKPKRKMPKFGERYYYITDSGNWSYTIWNSVCDEERYNIRNVYKTEEEVSLELEHNKTEALLRNYADEHNECELVWTDAEQAKYYLFYDFEIECLAYDEIWSVKENNIYFSSKAIARAAVKEIGEERVTRFYRGY